MPYSNWQSYLSSLQTPSILSHFSPHLQPLDSLKISSKPFPSHLTLFTTITTTSKLVNFHFYTMEKHTPSGDNACNVIPYSTEHLNRATGPERRNAILNVGSSGPSSITTDYEDMRVGAYRPTHHDSKRKLWNRRYSAL